MVIDLIGENNSNELCDTCKDQISMQRLLVLGPASCKTEIIFDVVDISFDNSPDFIGIIPFFGSADHSGISTKILFRVDVDHPPTFRRGTRVVTETMTRIRFRLSMNVKMVFLLDENSPDEVSLRLD